MRCLLLPPLSRVACFAQEMAAAFASVSCPHVYRMPLRHSGGISMSHQRTDDLLESENNQEVDALFGKVSRLKEVRNVWLPCRVFSLSILSLLGHSLSF